MQKDAFELNIQGVADLIGSGTNKTEVDPTEGGDVGEYEEALSLKMSDEELIKLATQWKSRSDLYLPEIEKRQKLNKEYYIGRQKSPYTQRNKIISSNLLFEATETFIPQALSRNPEPVVFSDNTPEGKTASNDLKTLLQYQADVLCLRRKLGVATRKWSTDFVAIMKHGWDARRDDIALDVRNTKNFILDPNGYVNEFGDFVGEYLGENIEITAEKAIETYEKHGDVIAVKVDGKLGTKIIVTEWWTDDYCFTTFQGMVLDKHVNPFFNYDDESEDGELSPANNHFAVPKMPYTFLSVFSFQEEPYDVTNLIEQNISNQDRIVERDAQISRNLASANNAVVVSGIAFTEETASQAVESFFDQGFVLVPNGDVNNAIKRIPANEIPSSVFKAQELDKETLKNIYGTQGLTATPANEQTTARGMILNRNYDSSRIGGSMGDALEQVADNIFNWWAQIMAVCYDAPHYGAIMGTGRAVEYARIRQSFFQRKFVISVSPNSMKPKDEISEMNQAIELANNGWLDPLSLFKALDYPDPMATAKAVTLWKTNPQVYMQMYFPEQAAPPAQQASGPANIPQEEGPQNPSLANPPESASLSQVPLPKL